MLWKLLSQDTFSMTRGSHCDPGLLSCHKSRAASSLLSTDWYGSLNKLGAENAKIGREMNSGPSAAF